MNPSTAAAWMLQRLEAEGCLYQDDVVDALLTAGADDLVRENDDGNVVIGTKVLTAFRTLSEDAVWVKPDRYWRWRVAEDELGRDQRG